MRRLRGRGIAEVLGCAFALVALPSDVFACSRAAIPDFAVDPQRHDLDQTAPSPFTDLASSVERINGTHCVGGTCTESSCGDYAAITLKFQPPQDDQDEETQLGYRIVWLSGDMPASLQPSLDKIHALWTGDSLAIELSYDDIPDLDGELALIAVDRAGNESEPSAPVHVQFNGCTRYIDSESCIEKEPSNCAIRAAGSGSSAWWFLPVSAVIAGVAGLRRRRRVRV